MSAESQRVTVSVPTSGRVRSRTTESVPNSSEVPRVRSFSNPFRNTGPRWTSAELCLADTVLYYEQDSEKCEFLLEDLLGIHVSPTPNLSSRAACMMVVHMFQMFIKSITKKKIRKMANYSFLFDNEEKFEDNLKVASEWKERILRQADIAGQEIFEQEGVGEGGGRSMGSSGPSGSRERRPRTFIVFVNPVAGVRRGERLFKNCVKPMFDVAEIKYEVIVTERQNHAHEMIQTMDLSAVDGIVIGSGDGLLYEVINGIMKRPDWDRIIKIPFGMLPLGSGNALVSSTLHDASEAFSLETAVFQILRGGYTSMDLTTIHTSDGGKCYMTILGAWGLTADVDIESEKFRTIGEARFVLGALNAVRKKRVYRGRLSYLMPENSHQEPQPMVVSSLLLNASEQQGADSSAGGLESLKSDGEANEQSISSGDSTGANVATNEDEALDATCSRKGDEFKTDYSNLQQHIHSEFPQPLTNLLVPLSSPVPETWVTAEDDFLNINFMTIPFLSREFMGDPNVKMGAGKIHIVIIVGTATRRDAINVVRKSGTGKHVELDQVKVVEAQAFRIEPITPGGIMAVDGEQVSYGPMQGQVHPRLFNVMSRKRKLK